MTATEKWGVLTVHEVPTPRPRGGGVHVRVLGAVLNPKDVLVRKGKFRFFSGWIFPQGVDQRSWIRTTATRF